MNERPDMELLRSYAETQSEEAFGVLVGRHLNLVYSTALRLVRTPHLAEEVAQTVFIILARKATNLPLATVLAGWLYRTTQFAATSALRSQRRRQLREQEPMDSTPSSEPAWAEIEPHIEGALSHLAEKDRCAVLLHYFERKSYREVATALGTTEDAAQKRVSRSLEKLRGILAKSAPLTSVATLAHLLATQAVHAAPAGLVPTVLSAAIAKAVPAAGLATTLTTTLKLMAWTQTKTTLIAVAVATLFLGLGTVGVVRMLSGSSTAANFDGNWEGSLEAGDVTLRLVTKMRRAENGSYSAVLDSIDQGAKDIPVTEVKVKGKTARIDLKALNATFEGHLSANEQEWSGTWAQLGKSMPMTFTRTNRPTSVAQTIPDKAILGKTGSDLQGYWKGTLNVGPTKLRLAFKIMDIKGGSWTATVDSLDQGAKNIPVTLVSFNKPSVEMEVNGIGGVFEGKMDTTGTEIDGKWSQGGKSFDLVLTRGEPEPDLMSTGSLVAENESDPQGEWNGVLDMKGTKIRIGLRVAKLPNGSFTGALDSPDQGAMGIPTTRTTHNPPLVRLEWAAMNAVYEGTIKGSKLTGHWQQGPAKLPLELSRKRP